MSEKYINNFSIYLKQVDPFRLLYLKHSVKNGNMSTMYDISRRIMQTKQDGKSVLTHDDLSAIW